MEKPNNIDEYLESVKSNAEKLIGAREIESKSFVVLELHRNGKMVDQNYYDGYNGKFKTRDMEKYLKSKGLRYKIDGIHEPGNLLRIKYTVVG